MRIPITSAEAYTRGITESALKWKVRTGRWQRIAHGVYLEGDVPATPMERALGVVIGSGGVASGSPAGLLHEFDSVALREPFVTVAANTSSKRSRRRRLDLPVLITVEGIACTDALQTLVDLSSELDDTHWERALESALRKRLVTIAEVEKAVLSAGASRTPGTRLMRRVLQLRPPNAPPTESLLETLAVQLVRPEPSLPEPTRQYEVTTINGTFVGGPDLSWPSLGVFIELDGRQHKDQPVYDAHRETSIVIATGRLPGRFTWDDIVRRPNLTRRRLVALLEQARRRL